MYCIAAKRDTDDSSAVTRLKVITLDLNSILKEESDKDYLILRALNVYFSIVDKESDNPVAMF